jgi:hypothetical protein
MTSANEIDFNLDGSSRRPAKPPRRPKPELTTLQVRNGHTYLNDEELPDDAPVTITASEYASLRGNFEKLLSAVELQYAKDASLENVKMILRNNDGRVIGMVERKVPREALVGAIGTTLHATPRP